LLKNEEKKSPSTNTENFEKRCGTKTSSSSPYPTQEKGSSKELPFSYLVSE